VVLKSTYHGTATLDASRLVVNEVTLVGSRCGPMAPALELLAARRVDVGSLLQARFPLEEGIRAFDEAARPGALKVMLDAA
jgi:threonine dehydrogenase-like Zn-dependent dehydrogenase